jgi:hypothetical protein
MVSGNSEAIDVDRPALVEPFEAAVQAIAPGLLERLTVTASPRGNYGGRHYHYRVELTETGEVNAEGKPVLRGQVKGNTKLAQSAPEPQFNKDGTPVIDPKTGKQKLAPNTWIETRGEGGYILAPGCPGECHETGLPYKHLSGPPLTEKTTITVEEQQILWRVAMSFNEYDDTPEPVKAVTRCETDGLSPGDDFTARTSWEDILVPHGWTVAFSSGDKTHWRRPGKDHGTSATTGCKSKAGSDLLCVFSSNAHPFQGATNGKPCSNYNKFAAYALLNHGGEFSDAAKDLAKRGYGDKPKIEPGAEALANRLAGAEKSTRPEKRGENRASADNSKVNSGRIDLEAMQYTRFPVEALPAWCGRFVKAVSRAIGCDESYVALPLLVMLAACIGSTRKLLIKQGWAVLPILWGAVVGESGTAKTAPFKLVMRPLRDRLGRALKRLADETKDYDAAVMRFEQELAEWKKQKNNPNPPPEKPRPPMAERCVVNDITCEALAPILLDNPRGLIRATDELAGLFGSFDRYAGGKGGSDAPHYLSMFSGESITVDRKKGIPPTIYVPQACLWIIGGIQPGILQKALSKEHRDNGFAARLLLAMPARRVKHWTESDIPEYLEKDLAHIVERLYELQHERDEEGNPKARLVKLSPEAKELFKQHFNSHASEQADLAGDLSAAWSKLEEYVARLALVHHFIRWAEGGNDAPVDAEILDAASMQAGIDLVRWFKGEAKRAYSLFSESDEQRECRELIEWLNRRECRQVSARFILTHHRIYKTSEASEAALNLLAKAGLGTWENIPPPPTGGHATRVLTLNDLSALAPSSCGKSEQVQIQEPEFTTQEAFDQAHAWEPPPAPLRPASQCDHADQSTWMMGKAGRMCCRWCSRTMPESEVA